jgi:V/A-type H+-transporting ATPase subunit F
LSYKVAVIGDADTATGFALAGVSYTHVHVDKEGTLAKLAEFIASEEIGLVLITHPVAEELGDEFRRMMRRKKMLPVVLRIPDKKGYMPKVDELYQLIKRTVGAEIVVRAEGG